MVFIYWGIGYIIWLNEQGGLPPTFYSWITRGRVILLYICLYTTTAFRTNPLEYLQDVVDHQLLGVSTPELRYIYQPFV